MKTVDCQNLLHARLDVLYGRSEVDAMTRLIMDEVLHFSPVDIVLRAQNDVPDFFPEALEKIISRLEKQEPIQYILGGAWFHGHRFAVTPATLIPRPETEQLVDLVVDENSERADLRVLDIGTGSGCIAISLARALKFAQVTGLDVSDEALAVASGNAKSLKAHVDWVEADLLANPQWPEASLDIVVSNPPYICQSERATMERNVLDYEPGLALFVPDDDPLLFYRPIARLASSALVPGGHLYLEVNSRFSDDVVSLLTRHGFCDAQSVRDSYGNVRFVTASRQLD